MNLFLIGLIIFAAQISPNSAETSPIKITLNDILKLPDVLTHDQIDCADDVIYLFHSQHPEAGGWLRETYYYQKYAFKTWNFCNKLNSNSASNCRQNWKETNVNAYNELIASVMKADPTNGLRLLGQFRALFDGCVTIREEDNKI